MSPEVSATIPGALFTTLREADHLVVMERPEEMADLISRFLQDHDLTQLDYTSTIECPTSPDDSWHDAEVDAAPFDASEEDFHDGASP